MTFVALETQTVEQDIPSRFIVQSFNFLLSLSVDICTDRCVVVCLKGDEKNSLDVYVCLCTCVSGGGMFV